jgi:lipid A 3-O-deacylase
MFTRISTWTPSKWNRWLAERISDQKCRGRPDVAAFFGVEENSALEKGSTLNRTGRLVLLILIVAGALASAQSTNAPLVKDETAESPVAAARNARSWEYGPFANGGTGVGDRSDFQFLSLGVQLGKPITPVLHAGVLSGQFELGGNVMPLWQAYTPAPHISTFVFQGVTYSEPIGGGTYTGFSITPVIFRWNFLTRSRRIQPWFQGAGGLVYTIHKFPPDVLIPRGTPGGTSVFNFTPQGGVGFHYFTNARHSIDLGVNAVHISSASLGDRNPGVNASIQVQVGYTFWK